MRWFWKVAAIVAAVLVLGALGAGVYQAGFVSGLAQAGPPPSGTAGHLSAQNTSLARHILGRRAE